MSYAREYNLTDGDTVYAEQYIGELDNLYDAINAVDTAKLDASEVAVSGANKVLRLNASGATGVNTTGNADTATLATTATNLAGGAAGSIPYQSGDGATAMLAAGTEGQHLKMGASAPEWSSDPPAGCLKKIGDSGWLEKTAGQYIDLVYTENAGDIPAVVFVYTADDAAGTVNVRKAPDPAYKEDGNDSLGIQVINMTPTGCRIQLANSYPFFGLVSANGDDDFVSGYTAPVYVRAIAFKVVV
jgi:hypothetical protein